MRITMKPASRTHNLNDNDRWWPACLFPLWVFVMQSKKVHGVQTASLPPCGRSGDGKSVGEEQKGSLWSRALTTKPLQSKSFPGLGWLRTLRNACLVPHPALAGQAHTRNRIGLAWSHCELSCGSMMWLLLPQSLPVFIISSCLPWGYVVRAGALALLQHSWLRLWASCHGLAAATPSATDSS